MHTGILLSKQNEQSKTICSNMVESHKCKPEIFKKRKNKNYSLFSLYVEQIQTMLEVIRLFTPGDGGSC